MHNFPDDDDGNTLKMLAESGFNMNRTMNIEFAVFAPDEASALSIEKAMKSKGYNNTEVYYDDGEEVDEELEDTEPSWTVFAHVNMVPDHDKIILIQEQLDQLSSDFGGYSDGWGVSG